MNKKTYALFGLYGTEWKIITYRTGRQAAREAILRCLHDVKAYRARLGYPALQMKIVPSGTAA